MSSPTSFKQEASKECRKKRHFVTASCRAQHPGNRKPANHAEKKSAILLRLVVVLNILETRSQQTMQKQQPHFVSGSCRAQHPGKQEASKPCSNNSPILLALVVVLNILETRSQQAMQKKQPHFVSASCRAQHPSKQEASEPCRNNSPILLALVVVPFCYG